MAQRGPGCTVSCTAIGLVLALAGLLASVATAADEDSLPTAPDPRIIEANALLEDASGWDRAATLYSAVLAEDPEHASARMWLARVLAWNKHYDESLAQYALLADSTSAPPDIAMERAEVLSWAGRYDEAVAAFESLIEEDPGNARALRGLARVYRWSGRERLAEQTFKRALSLAGDDEAQQELIDLQAELGGHAQSHSEYLSDSDDVRLMRFTADGSVDIGFVTRVVYGATFTRIAKDRDPTDPLLGRPQDDQGFGGYVGLEHRFGNGLRAQIELGGTAWRRSNARALARGELEYTVSDRTTLGAQLSYGDSLDLTQSLDAVLDGIDAGRVRGWLWRDLGHRVSSHTYVDYAALTDGNQRVAAGGSVDYQPWEARDLRVQASFYGYGFTDRSSVYYDPSADLGGLLSVSAGRVLAEYLEVKGEVGVGLGYAKEGGLEGFGPTYQIAGGPVFHHAGWWAGVRGNFTRSQRASAYHVWGLGLDVGRSF